MDGEQSNDCKNGKKTLNISLIILTVLLISGMVLVRYQNILGLGIISISVSFTIFNIILRILCISSIKDSNMKLKGPLSFNILKHLLSGYYILLITGVTIIILYVINHLFFA